jgi:hypothetical protein
VSESLKAMALMSDYCQTETIAAYLDGDLDELASATLEQHLRECKVCAEELRTQQLFLCELEASLVSTSGLPVPANFARIVAANAKSDMRGARNLVEHKRALRFCLILGAASFALLGATASKALILSGQVIASEILGVGALIWKALYDAVVGLTVISRVLSRGLLPGSNFGSSFVLLAFALAVVLLSLLISRYHRARLVE